MTITFENDNKVIVYALEKIIAYSHNPGYIFAAHCVWWLASIIGLERGLINFIDDIQSRIEVQVIPDEVPEGSNEAPEENWKVAGEAPEETTEERQDKVLKVCEELLRDSRRQRDIAALKSKGKTKTRKINPLPISKQALRKKYNGSAKENLKSEGISDIEIQRRIREGECLHCAWPSKRKAAHKVKDCIRPIKLDKSTASYPKEKAYKQAKILKESSGPDTNSSSEGDEE
jgi:hypothetical protein